MSRRQLNPKAAEVAGMVPVEEMPLSYAQLQGSNMLLIDIFMEAGNVSLNPA